ncbi:MAG: hypothetical protein AB8H80_10995 [Planctomycetota bacterium]
MSQMVDVQVKKVVAVCFLEAVKLTLEHLGARRLELSQEGVSGGATEEMTRVYGDLRRVRDYLQRCVSSYRDVVSLELDSGSASMLVASCRRMVEAIEHRLHERALPDDERQWLRQKIQVLSDWAVEVAGKPIIDLPLARVSTLIGEFGRALTTRIQGKVWGNPEGRQKIVPPTEGKGPSSGGSTGLSSFGDMLRPVDEPGEDEERAHPAPGGSDSIATSSPLTASPLPPDVDPEALDTSRNVGESSMLPPAHEAEEQGSGGELVDVEKIRDPRLRSLAAMDIKSLQRAQSAGDYRVAAVLVGAIAESVVLDYALPRRIDLGLPEEPEAWPLSDILLGALGDAAQPRDRAFCFHLFSARNLLRPSRQVVTPVVVTATSFVRIHEFVGRAFSVLGYGMGVFSADRSDATARGGAGFAP